LFFAIDLKIAGFRPIRIGFFGFCGVWSSDLSVWSVEARYVGTFAPIVLPEVVRRRVMTDDLGKLRVLVRYTPLGTRQSGRKSGSTAA
jgi:hypothetical protein